MALRHPCHDLAIVVTKALSTDSRIFMLAFGGDLARLVVAYLPGTS